MSKSPTADTTTTPSNSTMLRVIATFIMPVLAKWQRLLRSEKCQRSKILRAVCLVYFPTNFYVRFTPRSDFASLIQQSIVN
jgi:hypothetical protein